VTTYLARILGSRPFAGSLGFVILGGIIAGLLAVFPSKPSYSEQPSYSHCHTVYPGGRPVTIWRDGGPIWHGRPVTITACPYRVTWVTRWGHAHTLYIPPSLPPPIGTVTAG
jgi:hypothetical protein